MCEVRRGGRIICKPGAAPLMRSPSVNTGDMNIRVAAPVRAVNGPLRPFACVALAAGVSDGGARALCRVGLARVSYVIVRTRCRYRRLHGQQTERRAGRAELRQRAARPADR